MKYDDDELAEAALLLAHHDETAAMPKSLANEIAESGESLVGSRLATTTRAGALAVENVVPFAPPTRRRSSIREWAGWVAAAACVGLFVYQWRIESLRTAGFAARGAAESAIVTHVAELRWTAGASSAEATIVKPLRTEPEEVVQIWVAPGSDPTGAVPVASFRCEADCNGQRASFGTERFPAAVRRMFVTKTRGERTRLDDRASVVAEGERGGQ